MITTPSFAQLESLLSTSPSAVARNKGALFLEYMKRNERLVGSIMTTIINRFQLFDCEGMAEVTATNEIDFTAMVDEPTALYLSIPLSGTQLYQPLLACFTMPMFRAFEHRGVLPRGVACYLDEFGNMGHIRLRATHQHRALPARSPYHGGPERLPARAGLWGARGKDHPAKRQCASHPAGRRPGRDKILFGEHWRPDRTNGKPDDDGERGRLARLMGAG